MAESIQEQATQDWMKAFHAAQAEFPVIAKTKTADMDSYSYKYADLVSILDAVRPVLHGHGLSIAQSPVSQDGRVGCETRIYHESGHVEVFGPLFLPAGNNAQGAGSAITYARRYSLTAALGIATEEDDDGKAASRREEPSQSPSEWLKTMVTQFSKWDSDQKNQAFKAVMEELEIERVDSMENAKRVHKGMAEAYYTEFPAEGDEAPF